MRALRRGLVGVALGLVVILTLGACSTPISRSERAGDDWSRGISIGTSILNNAPGVSVDQVGQSIMVVFAAAGEEDGSQVLRLVRLDRSGEALSSTDLAVHNRLARTGQGTAR